MLWAGAAACATEPGEEIRAETFVSEAMPYVQQTVILTIRIYHGPRVSELTPEAFNPVGFSLSKLETPPQTTRSLGRGQRMVSDFRYALTPLSEGLIEVPAVRIKVVSGGSQGYPWGQYRGEPKKSTVTAPSAVLSVRPRAVSGQSWLPLYGLRISAKYDQGQRVRVGEPVTLSLVQTAWGSDGDHLPSLAPQLASPDLSVYTEQSQTFRMLAPDGGALIGRRSETFTLVPQHGGRIRVPSARVSWWDLSQNREAATTWAGMELPVESGSGAAAVEGMVDAVWQELSGYRLLLAAIAAFALGWWIRAGRLRTRTDRESRWGAPRRALGSLLLWTRERWRRRASRAPAEPVEVVAAQTGSRVAAVRVRPRSSRRRIWSRRWRRLVGRGRAALARLRPVWLDHWVLRRGLAASPNPAALEGHLRQFGHRVLGLSPNASMASIGEALAAAYPRAPGPVLRQHLERLDGVLYGAEEFDFDSWRTQFRRLLRKVGYHRPLAAARSQARGLPDLNPSP